MCRQSEGSTGQLEKGETGGTGIRLKRSQLVVLFVAFVVFRDLPACAYSPEVSLTRIAVIQMLIFFDAIEVKVASLAFGTYTWLHSRSERRFGSQGSTWPGSAVSKMKASP